MNFVAFVAHLEKSKVFSWLGIGILFDGRHLSLDRTTIDVCIVEIKLELILAAKIAGLTKHVLRCKIIPVKPIINRFAHKASLGNVTYVEGVLNDTVGIL